VHIIGTQYDVAGGKAENAGEEMESNEGHPTTMRGGQRNPLACLAVSLMHDMEGQHWVLPLISRPSRVDPPVGTI